MTATEISFLEDLADAQVVFVNKISTQIWMSDPNLLSVRKTKVSLVNSMIDIINYWFRDTNDIGTTDDNFFDVDEIQQVIDHANKLMGSTVYIDLSDYS